MMRANGDLSEICWRYVTIKPLADTVSLFVQNQIISRAFKSTQPTLLKPLHELIKR